MKYILNNNHKQEIIKDEIDSIIISIMLASSGDTTIVIIAITIYFTLKNPAIIN